MDKVTEYRAIAAKFREEALMCGLPQRRELALRAAQHWETLASDLEAAIAPGIALGGKQPDWFI